MNRGYWFVLAAVTMWAIGGGYFSQVIDVPGTVLVAIASGFGAAALAAMLVVRGKFRELWPASAVIAGYLLVIALGQALNNGTFFIGLKATSVANAQLAHNLQPVLMAVLFAPLFLKERITKAGVLAALMGFGGLALILQPSLAGGVVDAGILWAALSAVFFALYLAVARKLKQREMVDDMVIAFWQLLISLLVFLPAVSGYLRDGGIIAANDWINLAIVGIVLWAASLTILFRAFDRIPKDGTTTASVLMYLEPVIAIGIAWAAFGQPVTSLIIVGGVLILGAAVASVLDANRRERVKSA